MSSQLYHQQLEKGEGAVPSIYLESAYGIMHPVGSKYMLLRDIQIHVTDSSPSLFPVWMDRPVLAPAAWGGTSSLFPNWLL